VTDFQDKKIALVTGASRGIGAAMVKALAADGVHVVAVARTQGALEALDDQVQAAGGDALTLLPMDLTKFADIDQIGPALYERFGRLDILVGNAGMLGPLTPVHQLEHKDIERVMRLNYAANARLVRNVDPLLRAAKAGRALFITSGMAEKCFAYYGAYAGSKAALNALVKSYAAELLQTRMKVNLLSPGMVATKMLAEAFPGGFGDLDNVINPDDVAIAALPFLRESCAQHGEIIHL
jgi:NAD(P)-dependent dehydrogenase (short-subunit alcohol dehydrogenase family)